MSNSIKTTITLTGRPESIERLKVVAEGVGLEALMSTKKQVNGDISLFIVPTDSKQGWPQETEHLIACYQFLAYLYWLEGNGERVEWVMTEYGDNQDNIPYSQVILSHATVGLMDDHYGDRRALRKKVFNTMTIHDAWTADLLNQWLVHESDELIQTLGFNFIYLLRKEDDVRLITWQLEETLGEVVAGIADYEVTRLCCAPYAFPVGQDFVGDEVILSAAHSVK